MADPVLYDQRGAVGWITLNRPDRLNAWTVPFAKTLRGALERADGDSDVRAVVLVGEGRGFSAGADLKSEEHNPADGPPDIETRLREVYHPVIKLMRTMGTPIVAAVRGPAVGIGCSLALASDLIVAGESAYFRQAFIKIGLMPDGGSTVFLPPLVGKARATELVLFGEDVSATRALELGMVNRVVPDEDLEAEAGSLAERLAAGPPLAIAEAKRALNASIYPHLDSQLDIEAAGQGRLSKTEDFGIGVLGFFSKQQPEFQGR